jgi:hypothetical protein
MDSIFVGARALYTGTGFQVLVGVQACRLLRGRAGALYRYWFSGFGRRASLPSFSTDNLYDVKISGRDFIGRASKSRPEEDPTRTRLSTETY